jgi:hypothetical protein
MKPIAVYTQYRDEVPAGSGKHLYVVAVRFGLDVYSVKVAWRDTGARVYDVRTATGVRADGKRRPKIERCAADAASAAHDFRMWHPAVAS